MTTDVYIIKRDENDEVNTLISLFSSSLFNVMCVLPPKPIGLPASKEMTEAEIYEAYQIQWCLTKTKVEKRKVEGVIILKSDSVTNVNAEFMTRFINEINSINTSFDIFYLCKWKDDCQKMTDITSFSELNIKIGRSYAPKGLQALYFTPAGMSIFLGDITMRNNKYFSIDKPLERKIQYELGEGNIIAYTSIGNIFNFDTSKATTNSDYDKTHECGGLHVCEKKSGNSGIYNYIWLIIILILIIVFMIIMFTVR